MDFTIEKTKENAINTISRLPENASIDDIFYVLYLQNKLQAGFKDLKSNLTYSNDEVKREIEKWLK